MQVSQVGIKVQGSYYMLSHLQLPLNQIQYAQCVHDASDVSWPLPPTLENKKYLKLLVHFSKCYMLHHGTQVWHHHLPKVLPRGLGQIQFDNNSILSK
jgi:hypothetical protein